MTSEKTSEPIAESTSEPIAESIPAAPAAPRWKAWWENTQILVVAIILALLIRSFVAEPRFIPSDSMVPTLRVGDRLVIEKISYRLHPPQFGDIVVFDPPPQLQKLGYAKDQAFIKRVIGQPGQTVEVRAGKVYINNQPLSEPYIAAPPGYLLKPVQVPAGEFFVMGDNRNNSNDSHVWGFLPAQNIIGRAWVRFFPFNRVSLVSDRPSTQDSPRSQFQTSSQFTGGAEDDRVS